MLTTDKQDEDDKDLEKLIQEELNNLKIEDLNEIRENDKQHEDEESEVSWFFYDCVFIAAYPLPRKILRIRAFITNTKESISPVL